AYQHEYVLVYSKNINVFQKVDFSLQKENALEMLKKVEELIKKHGSIKDEVKVEYQVWLNENRNRFSGGEYAYNRIDADGHIYQEVSMAAPDKPETRSHRPLIHPITGRPCPVPAKGWRYIDQTMDKFLENNEIKFGTDESTQPRRKYFLKDNLEESVASLIYYG